MKTILFADDTTFINNSVIVQDVDMNIQITINEAIDWFIANKLVLNETKTQNLVFSVN